MYEFASCRVSKGNLIFRDKIIITDDKVEFYKATLVGYKKKVILRENIQSVSIKQNLLFADITIEAIGGTNIFLNGYLRGDAKKIRNILMPE